MKACDWDQLGLTDSEGAGLTGFTTRMVDALAHLREAWCVADNSNAQAIEAGILAMMQGHSFQRNRRLVAKVLSARLDSHQRAALLGAVGLGATTVERSVDLDESDS